MFFDGRNAIIYDRRVVMRDTDIGGWNCSWNLMQTCCQGYLDPIGFLDLPLVLHEDKSNYVLCLAALVERAEEIKGLIGLDDCCLDRPYDRY